MASIRPFQRLDHRLTGKPLDETMHEGVPVWLEPTLREWIAEEVVPTRRDGTTGPRLAERTVLRLQLEPFTRTSHSDRLVQIPSDGLLLVVDAILQLHPHWDTNPRAEMGAALRRHVRALDEALIDGSSAYHVDEEGRCLVRRLDATVGTAAERARASATGASSDHLREAWLAAFGLSPDPDKVFNESMRAVESLVCPLVEPVRAGQGRSTLGTVIGELRNSGHKWELALPGADGNPRSVDHVVGMFEILWQAQVSRHGGAPKSRRQDQAEAEAAVQLTVTLVQWLSTGVLRRKP